VFDAFNFSIKKLACHKTGVLYEFIRLLVKLACYRPSQTTKS